MAGKTRSSSMAEDTAVSFTKHMDNYTKNSEVCLQKPSSLQFKQQFVRAAEISCLKDELAKLKSELDEVKAKANNNKQYSRRNSIRIFGQNEEEGEDCCAKVVDLCENVLEIEVGRNELDIVHRVSWSWRGKYLH